LNWEPTLSLLGKRIQESAIRGRIITLPAIPSSAEAMLVLAAGKSLGKTILWIAPGEKALETNHESLLALCGDDPAARRILYYPAWESLPEPAGLEDTEISGERIGLSFRLLSDQGPCKTQGATQSQEPLIIATCVQAILQRTIPPATLAQDSLVMELEAEYDLDDTVRRLEQLQYDFKPEVATKGQASLRGCILDIWPPTEEWPFRLEFDNTMLVSARVFNPLDQKSLRQVTSVNLLPASEWGPIRKAQSAPACIAEYIPDDIAVVWSDFPEIEQRAFTYSKMLAESGNKEEAMAFDAVHSQLKKKASFDLHIGSDPVAGSIQCPLDILPIEGAYSIQKDVLEPDVSDGARRSFIATLRERASRGQTVCMFFDTNGAMDRYKELHAADLPAKGFHLQTGIIPDGFSSEELGLAVISEKELFGHRKIARARYAPHSARGRPDASSVGVRIADTSDLHPGDMVVHVQHGIGKYIGLQKLVFDGQLQEVMTIEYADNILLHVPFSQSHLLSLYVGVSGHAAKLHQIGGVRWIKEKIGAQKSIEDCAASMLEIQAERQILEGHAFKPDTPWQHEFESAFPYRETPDQEQAIQEVKRDMENKRPMDRLICGDVGFGKTEVAIRAAFKAVMDGKQVAVLVPTTILRQQHFQTFQQRMAAYPVRVDMLSRFCPRSQRDATLRDLHAGKVDIVIGTHCLLQPGIEIPNLGLVIIDEEQRFGVSHKEKLKHMRRLVDVLTLTATPIPRTLYMGLIGTRDLSTVQTPPEHRLPVMTIITENTDTVIRNAIIRELSRDGQVYYLHNRVMSIDRVRERLCQLVPEARIATGHGQMSAGELARVMDDFIEGKSDVLLCTTIIESGLDIPNVNTIMIDRADRFGLADLYQLRGRVGRSTKKGYAYLLLPPMARIDPVARKRVNMLRKYSHLGSGFNLALRDLETRGAGSLLGTEQSGHIAQIGFLLYCQLLKRTVARMKGKPLPPVVDVLLKLDFISLSPDEAGADNSAVIPATYIRDDRLRLNAYRDIAGLSSTSDIKNMKASLKDRYGPVPGCVERLFLLATLRIVAAEKRITAIETRDDRIMLMRSGEYLMEGSHHARMKSNNIDRKIAEIIRCARKQ